MRSLNLLSIALSLGILTVLPGCFEDYEVMALEDMTVDSIEEDVYDCDSYADLMNNSDINTDILAALADGGYYDEASQLLAESGILLDDEMFDDVMVFAVECPI